MFQFKNARKQYEELVDNSLKETERIFRFCGLPLTKQTIDFLRESHERHIEDPYSVFKKKSVKDKWLIELDREKSLIS